MKALILSCMLAAGAFAAAANFKLQGCAQNGAKVTDLAAHRSDKLTFTLSGDAGDTFEAQMNVVSADGKTTHGKEKKSYKIGPGGTATVDWTVHKNAEAGGRIMVFGSPKLKADGTADKLASFLFEVVVP